MRMTGFDMYDVDLLDEEYFGPPPRFLVDNNPRDFADAEPDLQTYGDTASSALETLKNFFSRR
jgi:hypothetical protein